MRMTFVVACFDSISSCKKVNQCFTKYLNMIQNVIKLINGLRYFFMMIKKKIKMHFFLAWRLKKIMLIGLSE